MRRSCRGLCSKCREALSRSYEEMGVYAVYDSGERLQYIGLSKSGPESEAGLGGFRVCLGFHSRGVGVRRGPSFGDDRVRQSKRSS